MNTPKLTSPFSGSQVALDAGRSKVANATHGLDFSRLLGQMRSDISVPSGSQSQASSASSRNDSQQSRVADTSERREPSQGSASSNQVVRAEDSGNRANAAPTDTRSSPNGTAAGSTRSNSNSSAADSAGQADATADTSGTATEPAAVENKAATGSPADDTQLAEAVAEAGIAGAVAAAQVNQPLVQGQAMVQGAAVVLDAAALPQAGGLATAPLNAQDGEAVVADPRLAALAALKGAASTDADPTQPMARMAAGQTQLPQHAAAVQVHAATAQQLQGVDLTPVNPATLAAQAVASLNATDALATQAAALSLSSDTPSGAAALSLQLQEFNAMVAAARATSGTSLPPLGGFAEAAGPSLAPQPLVGLMPAGLIPGQSFAPTAPAGISAPLSSPQWPSELGRQFISIAQAAKGVGQIAELRLDPPELGPLRITINLNDNVAHAVFSSPHALVRQTVENALPQLQQMLEQAGISLGQANVNDQHQSGQASQDGSSSGGAPGRQAGTGVAAEGTEMAAGREGRSANPDALVDTFA